MSQPLPMRGTVQTTATGDSRPPIHYGTAALPSTTERRLSQPLREGGCPNRCRCVAPSKRRRLGTVALPTTTERRLSHPLRNGGRPNYYGTAVVPTAADTWHRPNDGDWGQSPSQPLRNGGPPIHYGTAVVPTATGGRLSQPLRMRGTAPTAADTSLSLKRPITPPTPTPLTHSASVLPSTHR